MIVDISLPKSKSIANRALLISHIAGAKVPADIGKCDDIDVMKRNLDSPQYVIDVGACGTAMRFLTAYFANIAGEHIITGTERMRNRPIGVLVDALRELGADIEYLEKEGYPPLLVRGKQLIGGRVKMQGDVSSQYISALLMIAPLLYNGIEIEVEGKLVSEPYVDMTISMMREYEVEVKKDAHINDAHIKDAHIKDAHILSVSSNSLYMKEEVRKVECDWSAASYWYSALSLSSNDSLYIRMRGLRKVSVQGDSAVASVFSKLGINTTYDSEGVVLKKYRKCATHISHNFSACPDLVQTMVVCCCMKGVKFRFTGLDTLRIKETDRIEALVTEMKKLGYLLGCSLNTISWDGHRCISSTDPIDTYNDHRMAMAFAPVMIVKPELQINDTDVVSKSYPNFWIEFYKLISKISK